MISTRIVSFLAARGWWFTDVSAVYEASLSKIGVRIDSDFSQFYLHADAGPSFLSRNFEIHQICWHIANTNYLENSIKLRKALGIADGFVFLDSFSGGGGFIYDKHAECVHDIKLGQQLTSLNEGILKPTYLTFNDFLEAFFLNL